MDAFVPALDSSRVEILNLYLNVDAGKALTVAVKTLPTVESMSAMTIMNDNWTDSEKFYQFLLGIPWFSLLSLQYRNQTNNNN